jgi:hypothetical protein
MPVPQAALDCGDAPLLYSTTWLLPVRAMLRKTMLLRAMGGLSRQESIAETLHLES